MDTLRPGQAHIPDEWKNTQEEQENEQPHEEEPQAKNNNVIRNLIEEIKLINTKIKNMEKHNDEQHEIKDKKKLKNSKK